MSFGSNFNNRKLFTGEAQSTTRSINMERYKDRMGMRSVDEVRMSRMRLKDQLNVNIYGPEQMRKMNNKVNNIQPVTQNYQNPSSSERKFNHIEAMKNVYRGN